MCWRLTGREGGGYDGGEQLLGRARGMIIHCGGLTGRQDCPLWKTLSPRSGKTLQDPLRTGTGTRFREGGENISARCRVAYVGGEERWEERRDANKAGLDFHVVSAWIWT